MSCNIGAHWVLLVADKETQLPYIFDSMDGGAGPNSKLNQDMLAMFKRYTDKKEMAGKYNFQLAPEVNACQQTDGHSCGVFVIRHDEYFVLDIVTGKMPNALYVMKQYGKEGHFRMYRDYRIAIMARDAIVVDPTANSTNYP